MKRKLLSVALLAVLSVGLVAACDNEDEDGGSGEYSIAITNKAELQEAWYVGDSTRSISVELSPTANATSEIASGLLTVESSAPSVIAATGLSLSAQSLGSATITVSWHGASDSVTLSVVESTYESIASINAGIKAGTIVNGDTVRFYGKVIGSMEQSTTHLYSGVYLGDGDESLMLYSGQISNLWFDGEEPIYHLGDDIAVAAEVSAYNGFYEFKPSLIVPLDSLTTSYSVTTPTVTVLDETGWNALTYTDVGDLIEMELTYVSGSVSTAASTHSTINCTIGESDVALYVNYHIGTDEVAALAQLIGSLDADDVITVTGVVGWYNEKPEICPQFIYANGKELAPSECVEVPSKNAPTEITISGENTVTIRDTISLSVSVNEGASRSVTWSSSDETIATVSAGGVVLGVGIGTTTITATSTIDPNISSAPFSITVGYITAPEAYSAETEYYLSFVRTSSPTGVYVFTGAMSGNYGAMSTTLSEGVAISYAPVTDGSGCIGFNLSFVDSNGTTQYICMNISGTYHNFGFSENPYTLGYSEEYDTFTALDGATEYYFGTYNDYVTMSCSIISYAATSTPSHLYDSGALEKLVEEMGTSNEPELEQVSTLVSGESYYFGYLNGSEYYLFNGNLYYTSALYCGVGTESALMVTVTGDDENGWTLTYTGSGEEEYTIYCYIYNSNSYDITAVKTSDLEDALKDDSSDSVLKSDASATFKWDSDNAGLTITLGTTECYVSTYAKYKEISLSSGQLFQYDASHFYKVVDA